MGSSGQDLAECTIPLLRHYGSFACLLRPLARSRPARPDPRMVCCINEGSKVVASDRWACVCAGLTWRATKAVAKVIGVHPRGSIPSALPLGMTSSCYQTNFWIMIRVSKRCAVMKMTWFSSPYPCSYPVRDCRLDFPGGSLPLPARRHHRRPPCPWLSAFSLASSPRYRV